MKTLRFLPLALTGFSLAFLAPIAAAAHDHGEGGRRIWQPDVVSTKDATEVRVAFSPDGKRMLFGRIGASDDPKGWDIYESVLEDGEWSAYCPEEGGGRMDIFEIDASAVFETP